MDWAGLVDVIGMGRKGRKGGRACMADKTRDVRRMGSKKERVESECMYLFIALGD